MFETGGIQVNLLNVFRALKNQFDFYLVVFKKTNSLAEKEVKKHIKRFFVINEKIFILKRNEKAIKKIEEIIKKVKPDLIESHILFADLQVRYAAEKCGFNKVVICQHGFGKGWDKKTQFLEKRQLSFTKLYICVSKWNQRVLLDMGIPRGKTTVRYNGVDRKKFKHFLKKRGKIFNVGFIGRLEYSKNPLLLSAIAEELVKTYKIKNFYIHVVGIGSLRERLEGVIKDKKLNRNFIFYGEIDHKKINKIYIKLDALLLTSNNESLPTSAIEALVSGIPVIAPFIGGIPEIVEDKKTGFLAKKERDYARFLSLLINNRGLYNQLTKNIAKKQTLYSKKFSLKDFLERRKNIWMRYAKK